MRLRDLIEAARALRPGWSDRRNVAALAARLGLPLRDAAWIYRRSRSEGFGAAMRAYEDRRAAPTASQRGLVSDQRDETSPDSGSSGPGGGAGPGL